MKKIFLAIMMGLAVTANADDTQAVKYECNDLQIGADYQIVINMNTRQAVFTEMRAKYILDLTNVHYTKKRSVMIYKGNMKDSKGTLTVIFNLLKHTASVYGTNERGAVNYMGRSFCEQVNPWD